MAGVTTRNIAYPEASDDIAPLETWFHGMATSIDDALAKNQSGRTTALTLGTTVGTATTATITFPAAFASVPNIVGSVSSTSTNSAYVVTFFNVSTTGCTAKITRVYGTTNDGNLFINWIAKVE